MIWAHTLGIEGQPGFTYLEGCFHLLTPYVTEPAAQVAYSCMHALHVERILAATVDRPVRRLHSVLGGPRRNSCVANRCGAGRLQPPPNAAGPGDGGRSRCGRALRQFPGPDALDRHGGLVRRIQLQSPWRIRTAAVKLRTSPLHDRASPAPRTAALTLARHWVVGAATTRRSTSTQASSNSPSPGSPTCVPAAAGPTHRTRRARLTRPLARRRRPADGRATASTRGIRYGSRVHPPSAPPARPPTRDLSPQCARLFAVSHHRCPEFKRPPLSALPLPCARADGVQLVVRNGDVGGPVPYGNAKCYNLNMKGGLQLLQPPLRSILKL